jgi:hypothetical protein
MSDDEVNTIGMVAVATMLVSFALLRSAYASLAFAIGWTLGSFFLALEGVWTLALIQAGFAVIAFRRYWKGSPARRREERR